jgi:hypothetical protein
MEEQIIVNRVSWMSPITLAEFVNPFFLT